MNPTAATPDVAAWKALEPYAQLVRALLPRAEGLWVFDAEGQLRWTTESTTGPDLPAAIESARAEAIVDATALGRILPPDGSDTSTYVWWLRDDHAHLIAIVAIGMRRLGAQELQPFSFVNSLVRPAMECLRRQLLAQTSIVALSESLSARDRDVELLLAVSQDSTDGGEGGDLKGLLGNAVRHLDCALVALIVPEKSIAVVRAAEGTTADTTLIARTHRQLLQLAQTRRESVIINRVPSAEGDPALPYRIAASPVRSSAGQVVGVLALFRRLSSSEFSQREVRVADLLARKACTLIEQNFDSLTGLMTRAAMQQRLLAMQGESVRTLHWSVLYLDSDQLHVINENFGMHVGDGVLARVGELIRRRLPPGGLACRLSGDRFAIALPLRREDASDFGETLRQGIEQLGASEANARLHVGCTLGVAQMENLTIEGLAHALSAAESACRAGKDRGRNRVEVYQDADVSIIRRFTDIGIAGDLRDAISAGRMRLDAQLIRPAAVGRERAVPHFELLLRMLSPRGEVVGPDRFLSAAQRYQMMPSIDRWVIGQTIAMLKPHAALLAARPVVFGINFSGQSLSDDGFADFVVNSIESSGLDPGIFCFELTESEAIAKIGRAEILIRRLRRMGCEVALDDFGTGLSSLSYLRTLPVTMLKIDGSFVRDVLRDARSESMVQAIAQLASNMQLITVAEYVETEELLVRLTALGVDYVQGFAVGKPIPLDQTLAELPFYAGASTVSQGDTDETGVHRRLAS